MHAVGSGGLSFVGSGGGGLSFTNGGGGEPALGAAVGAVALHGPYGTSDPSGVNPQ